MKQETYLFVYTIFFFLYFLDQSASKLMEIIDKTTNNETGHFYDVDGTKLPF